MSQLWAAALTAKNDREMKYEMVAIVVNAENSDEALGVALRAAREHWGANDGWLAHQAAVQEIDPSYFHLEYIDGEWREAGERG